MPANNHAQLAAATQRRAASVREGQPHRHGRHQALAPANTRASSDRPRPSSASSTVSARR